MERVELRLPGQNDYFTEEAYKVLRTNLQFCGQDIKIVLITSCNENEGKTVVALHLAKSLAELGKRVLVIDADMRKSVMAGRNAGVRHHVGLSEVLTGMNKPNECIYSTQYDRMHILFAGKYPPNPVELLNGKYFAALLSETRKIYDYVIVDSPPLGRVIDAAVVAANCDGTILVIGGDHVRHRQAQEVVDQLKKSGSKILGVVRNSSSRKTGAIYYGRKAYRKTEYGPKTKGL